MRGIIFLGDSYTWGQGLHYYGLFEETILPKKGDASFNDSILTDREKQLMYDTRFSKIVTNHFKTKSIQTDKNGGGHSDMFKFLKTINLEEYDTLIIQLTDIFRDTIHFEHNGKKEFCHLSIHQDYVPEMFTTFIEHLSEKYNGSFDLFKQTYSNRIVNDFKELFLKLENIGIKCFIHTWQNDCITPILNDEFMKDRFIQYDYNNKLYLSLFQLSTVENPNLIITHDPYFKTKNIQVNDGHISLECHRIVANSIINKIKEVI